MYPHSTWNPLRLVVNFRSDSTCLINQWLNVPCSCFNFPFMLKKYDFVTQQLQGTCTLLVSIVFVFKKRIPFCGRYDFIVSYKAIKHICFNYFQWTNLKKDKQRQCPEISHQILLLKIFTAVHFRMFPSFLVTAANVFAGVATMELLQFLKCFNKKWYFICTIYSITYCFSLIFLTLIQRMLVAFKMKTWRSR